MDRMAFQLPGGFVDDDGQVHDHVILSPLCGFSERMVAGRNGTPAPVLLTALLSRCIDKIGSIDQVTEGMVRRLLVGDRLFLLLKLREMTFGRNIQAVINCSFPDCRARADIDFATENIPITQSPQGSLWHRLQLSPAAGGNIVTFRLPNGEDQEMLTHLLDSNEDMAADKLLARCVESIDAVRPAMADIITLPPTAKAEIEQEMERLAPRISTSFEARCPVCDRSFTAAFDVQEFVMAELNTRLDLLLKEVHYLAFHYHWSEKEILGMTRQNRRRYIEVLSEEMERLNHA
ncbi:MAG: hypothetical protein KKC76_06240 [Proteobacteria bacterium]|nr:hypothetical protein [Pseudomonadota bacterium]MBU4297620.1 hypothetical protein [Pseudomonadota bacterium]MCG2750017.1 hypothetical protein [Desulfobulbaceae bacterium]